MFGIDAFNMIKMMGHTETIPGAILAKDIPMALSRLNAALAKEPPLPPTDENENDDNEPAVSISHRALPLINLLTAAAEAGCDLMWE